MADLDTAAKRNSGLDHEEVWQWGTPIPDGAIGQGDRQHSIWSYSGILSSLVVVTPFDLTLFRRTADLTLQARTGAADPALWLLEDESGYWLFEDAARWLGEAGDTGTPLTLRPRSPDLTLPDL